MTELREVLMAEHYRQGAMGSLGNARLMLIVQHNYPHWYDPEKDTITSADDDRLRMWDNDHYMAILKKFGMRGPAALGQWLRDNEDKRILAFIIEATKAEEHHPEVKKWVGYRVMGTVTMNGNPIYTLELFARGKGSKTKLFSGTRAPNIVGGGGVFDYSH